jgi:hypothetical protein
MTKSKKSKKGKSEKLEVVHAWCKFESLPGVADPYVYLLLRHPDGSLSRGVLQPEECSVALQMLRLVGEAANRTLCAMTASNDVLSAWPVGPCRLEGVLGRSRGRYVVRQYVIDSVASTVAHALADVVRTVTEFARRDWEEVTP